MQKGFLNGSFVHYPDEESVIFVYVNTGLQGFSA